MMAAVTEWLRRIMAAAFFSAALAALIPAGAVKRISMLCCSLLMLLTLFRPFVRLQTQGSEAAAWEGEILAQAAALEEENREAWAALIEEELVSYIVSRAAEEELCCTANVMLEADENGVPLPVSVELTAPRQSEALQRCLEEELGFEAENIRWRIE